MKINSLACGQYIPRRSVDRVLLPRKQSSGKTAPVWIMCMLYLSVRNEIHKGNLLYQNEWFYVACDVLEQVFGCESFVIRDIDIAKCHPYWRTILFFCFVFFCYYYDAQQLLTGIVNFLFCVKTDCCLSCLIGHTDCQQRAALIFLQAFSDVCLCSLLTLFVVLTYRILKLESTDDKKSRTEKRTW